MARNLSFFDGAQSETAPTIGNIIASGIITYANDAAYEANEQGAPVEGNIYFNETTNLIRYYNGTIWINLVDDESVQTIINKNIDADNNTITNLENDNIKAGAAIDASKIHDGSVSNAEFGYLDGVTSPIQTQLNDKQNTSEKGVANGYASLDANGYVPSSQIPPVAITDVSVVADIPARDALTVEEGDVSYVTSESKWYIYDGTGWLEITAPGDVNSVNGQTGTVLLDTDDIPEGATNKYATGSIDTHSDVDTTGKNNGDVLTYVTANNRWEALPPATASVSELTDLTDVIITSPALGNILEYNGSSWVNVPANKIQTKILTSNVTTNTTISDLTFNNLTVGKWYEVTGSVHLVVNDAVSDTTIEFNAINNAVTINRSLLRNRTVGDTLDDINVGAISFKFQAAATTLTFQSVSATANSYIEGSGSRTSTYIQLEERNNLYSTTDFT